VSCGRAIKKSEKVGNTQYSEEVDEEGKGMKRRGNTEGKQQNGLKRTGAVTSGV